MTPNMMLFVLSQNRRPIFSANTKQECLTRFAEKMRSKGFTKFNEVKLVPDENDGSVFPTIYIEHDLFDEPWTINLIPFEVQSEVPEPRRK